MIMRSSAALTIVATVLLCDLALWNPLLAQGSFTHPRLYHDSPTKTSADGQFLIARRDMPDPRFRQTVVFVVRHDANGALGLIINRPTSHHLGELIPDLQGLDKNNPKIHFGGPVALTGLMYMFRISERPDGAAHIMDDLYLGTNRQGLQELIEEGKQEHELRVYLGHAGWAPGQLEGELARGDWHLHPADIRFVLEREASLIWPELIEQQDPGGQLVLRAHTGNAELSL